MSAIFMIAKIYYLTRLDEKAQLCNHKRYFVLGTL